MYYSLVLQKNKEYNKYLEMFKRKLDMDEYKIIFHHCTLLFSGDKDIIKNSDLKNMISKRVIVQATHIGQTKKAIAFKVKILNKELQSYKYNSHITIAVNKKNNGKPVDSNNIQSWEKLKQPILFETFLDLENYKLYNSLKSLPFYDEVKQNKGEIYAVGGNVRDKLLGKDSKDLDILITNIPINNLLTILKKYGEVNMVGESFGIIKFLEFGKDKSYELDIALPRTERKVGSSHGHKDFEVNVDHNLKVEDDLPRRDFSFNQMAVDEKGNLIDPFGGADDIKNKIINVKNLNSFTDDPLRMLRAVQFSARFKFKISNDALNMIKKSASLISNISGERIIEELNKIVEKGNPLIGAYYLVKTDLYTYVFGRKYSSALKISRFDKISNLGEFLFMILKDVFPNFNEIEKLLKDKLKVPNEPLDYIKALYKIYEIKNTTESSSNIEENRLTISKAYRINKNAIKSKVLPKNILNMVYDMYRKKLPMTIIDMDITGDEIIALGFKGKKIGEILSNVQMNIYKENLPNKKQMIIKYVKENFN